MSMTKAQAGRLGGLTTLRRHGRNHFVEIGRKGARAFWQRYKLLPVGVNKFAIVDKHSGKIVGVRP